MTDLPLDLMLFAALCGAILLGFPIVFTLTGLAVLFASIGTATGHFDWDLLGALFNRIFGIMTNDVLMAIPLFVLMGVVLERSRIAGDLLEEMGRLFGSVRGGIAVSVTLVGALLAASTAIVGATVVTMGLIALPTMLRHGYNGRFAAGSVCAAGTLGQIIPPSTMLIILSERMSAAYQEAQFEMGRFSVETISVGQIFAAAIGPGLMLVCLYIGFALLLAWFRPDLAPAIPHRSETGTATPARGALIAMLVPPVLLIVAVLGSILAGIATPTEAASVGAAVAILLAALKLEPARARLPVLLAGGAVVTMLGLAALLDLRLGRRLSTEAEVAGIWAAGGLACVFLVCLCLGVWRIHRNGILVPVLTQTLKITSMIFATIIGASVFALVFRGLGGDERVAGVIQAMPGGETGALLFFMVLIFLLGFVMDFVEIAVIVIPIVAPILLLQGVDPLWLSVLVAMNLQTSFLTPPFGFSLFYLRGAAPPEIHTLDIYRGVAPFVLINLVGMMLVYAFPALGTWLPAVLF